MASVDGILKVIADVVVATEVTPDGKALTYHYRNALLFPGVGTPKERAHLLRRGLVAPVERSEVAAAVVAEPAEDDGADSASGGDGDDGPPADAVPFDAQERAEARAKLPADGSLPDGRAAHAVWVEAAVARGYAYNAVQGEDKKAIAELLGKTS